MNQVTRILNAIEEGDLGDTKALLPMVYDELRQMAAQKLARERPGHTLQATALVHEAYVYLNEHDKAAADFDEITALLKGDDTSVSNSWWVSGFMESLTGWVM